MWLEIQRIRQFPMLKSFDGEFGNYLDQFVNSKGKDWTFG
jgi:hypothetical protein